jgi:hypothetical protein
MELKVDPERLAKYDANPTGYYVRAEHAGSWSSFDINTLDRESLLTWLRSREGPNRWMEGVVLGLLGHPPSV